MTQTSLEEITSENTRSAKAISGWGELYFRPRNFERAGDGRMYRWLGVQYFKKIVPSGGTYWRKLFKEKGPVKDATDKKQALRDHEPFTRIAEGYHAGFSVAALGVITHSYSEGNSSTLWIILGNLLANFYPLLLQRYNRARIYNTIEGREIEK